MARADDVKAAAAGDLMHFMTDTESEITPTPGQVPSGYGNVVGPKSSITDGHLAVWDTTNRKLKDGGAVPAGGGGGGGGGDSIILSATITLTNAQIKAIPVTPQLVIAAPGAGKMIFPLQAIFQNKFAVGYGNTSAGDFEPGDYSAWQEFGLVYGPDQWDGLAVLNDFVNTIDIIEVDVANEQNNSFANFFVTVGNYCYICYRGTQLAEGGAGAVNVVKNRFGADPSKSPAAQLKVDSNLIPIGPLQVRENVELSLSAYNGPGNDPSDSEAFTAGDPSNTMTVKVLYILLDV